MRPEPTGAAGAEGPEQVQTSQCASYDHPRPLGLAQQGLQVARAVAQRTVAQRTKVMRMNDTGLEPGAAWTSLA